MFVRKDNFTVTLSSLGAGSGYSTACNGLLHALSVLISKAVGANASVVLSNGDDTTLAILTVKDPSTNKTWFYPRQRLHGTTGNQLSSSVMALAAIPLAYERLKAVVSSSSGLSGETVNVGIRIV